VELGDGVSLPLIAIPAGEFVMGSPVDEPERRESEGPQHRVRLEGFLMGQTPITQAQWRAVALLPPVTPGHDLNPSPSAAQPSGLWSRFARPGCLPVDSVSWLDCQEWLRRLNHWLAQTVGETAPRLSLPSESQWEAACRAGSTTPFHTGDSLDPRWANFDGTYAYGQGRHGPFRQGPTAVGEMGLANAWGVADMHGQLWEWCQDLWHPSPLGAPPDGQAWEEPDPALLNNPKQEDRVLRGGCWCSDPRQCRSASRGGSSPIFRDNFVGFRLVCGMGEDGGAGGASRRRASSTARGRRKAP
jgi:formylglycine-generating enzyme required for sulfatase activity